MIDHTHMDHPNRFFRGKTIKKIARGVSGFALAVFILLLAAKVNP